MRAFLVPAMVAAAPAAAPPRRRCRAAPAAPVHGRAVVAAMQKLLDEHYVLPEVRPKFDAILAKGLAAGRYDVSDPKYWSSRLNEDLGTVTPDKHLGVMYDPETSAKLASAGPDAGADDAPPTAEDIADAKRRNSGLVQMRILRATSATSKPTASSGPATSPSGRTTTPCASCRAATR